jgi:long-chain fatty acid transport protein
LALDSKKASFFMPEFAFTHKFNKFLWAGLGVHTSSRHEVSWPIDRFNPLVYDARQFSFETLAITPAIAFKVSKRFSIGASLGINFSSGEFVRHFNYDMLIAELTNGLVQDAQDFILSLKNCRSTFLSYGFGINWKLSSKLDFGFSAEGSMGGNYSVGTVIVRESDTPFEELNRIFDAIFIDSPEQKAMVQIRDIATFKWGLAWKPSQRLTFEADAYLPFWMMFDTVTIQFEKPMISALFRWQEVEGDFSWKNPISLRIGAEYEASERLSIRMGAFLEPSPVQDEQFSPTFPYTDQRGLSAGLGWRSKKMSVSVAYRYLNVSGRNVTNRNEDLALNGLTKVSFASRSEYLFAIGLNYQF